MSDDVGYYRTLFEHAPDGMAVVDLETGAHLDVNQRYCELHGYTEGELLDRGIGTLTADDRASEGSIVDALGREAADGDPFEWRNQRRDGAAFPVEISVSHVEGDDGPAVVVRVTDATEASERESELQWKTRAMEEAPVGITISDPQQADNPVVYANAEFERLTGYTEDDVLGRNCRFLQGEATDQEPVRRLREAIDAEEPVTAELRNYRKDGTEFWNRVTVAPIRDDSGTVENYVGFQEDVTERVEQEQEVARFERLVDHLPVGVFRSTPGPDGEFLEANPALVSMFGADSKAELLTHDVSELYCDRADRQTFSERLQAEGEVDQQELRFRRVDGEPFWGQTTAVVVEDDGEVYFEGVVQDVSTRKAYEQRIEAQRDKLELLNEVVRHDIRNDLQLVVAYAELLEDHVDAAAKPHLSTIEESASNAIELTKTARDLAETVLQTDADREPVSLNESLEAQIEEVRSTYEDAVVALDGPVPSVTVLANEMLASVFRNVLKNAIQHNDADVPEVTVSVTVHDDRVVVRIADNGPGVPDDRKTEIFGKGEKGLESNGTGIGLYLVNTLVDQYGGDVWVEDRTDRRSGDTQPPADDADTRGTVFGIELERQQIG
jgi:PAS domain S-box-containing protein